MDYDRHLRTLKPSFSGGGEGPFYFRVLGRVAHRSHLDWLDIGIGRDGSTLRPFVDSCRARGQTLAITGIDPDARSIRWEEEGVHWSLIRSTFQAWTPTGPFDVVNADQSLYYVGDVARELKRAIAVLKPGGILVATCWSRADTMHRLREQLFPVASHQMVGEDLAELLRSLPQLEDLEVAEFRTTVRLRAWLDDPNVLEAAVRVVARFPLGDDEVSSRVGELRKMLEGFPAVAPRVNIVLCATRAGGAEGRSGAP